MKFSEPTRIFEELYQTIGLDATIAICRKFGGQRRYIPKLTTGLKEKRDRLIYEQYKHLHYPTKMLSYRWNLSQRRIQQIIEKQAMLLGRDKAATTRGDTEQLGSAP